MNTLLNFSGGIDSTYCLYHWLKDNPNEIILIHHCKLKNFEGRQRYEYAAVQHILNWLRENNLTNFKYIESSFDYGSLGYIIRDAELMTMFTSIILRNPKHKQINKYIITVNIDELGMYKNSNFYDQELIKRKKLLYLLLNREIELIFPIKCLNKLELINGLPKDLIDLTWYCRKPINGTVCGKCHTCKFVKNALTFNV